MPRSLQFLSCVFVLLLFTSVLVVAQSSALVPQATAPAQTPAKTNAPPAGTADQGTKIAPDLAVLL